MKRFLPLLALLAVAGCTQSEESTPTTDPLKQSMDRATDVETDSNINSINQALSLAKGDNDGKAPATLAEAKTAAKVPDVMWTDKVTGQPLEYDPASGTVHRQGAAANSAPSAGSRMAPGSANTQGGGGF